MLDRKEQYPQCCIAISDRPFMLGLGQCRVFLILPLSDWHIGVPILPAGVLA